MGTIKIIWEFIKNLPAIVGIFRELIKLISSIAKGDGGTDDGIKEAKKKLCDLRKHHCK